MQHLWKNLNSRVCPWWFNPTFDNPLRRLVHDPEKILSPYVKPGMVAADVGCGMGYFTLSLAEMVGENGIVYAVDIQTRSLEMLRRRADRAGLRDRIRTVLAQPDELKLDAGVDFLLTNWMVHETPDPARFLEQATGLLKPGGKYLLVEPLGHVGAGEFQAEVDILLSLGLTLAFSPPIFFSRAAVFKKD